MSEAADKIKHEPRVVLLTPTLDGGLGRVISLLAANLKLKSSVAVWTLTAGAYAQDTEKTASVHYLSATRGLLSLREIISLLRAQQPTVILSASFHMNCVVLLARMLAQSRSRIIIAEHTALAAGLSALSLPKYWLARVAIRVFYPRADGWIAVSKGVAHQLALYANIAFEDVTVIYNPVIEPTLFSKGQQSAPHEFFVDDDPVLLAVGRMTAEKEYPTMLRALATVRQRIPARLIILGDGPDREQLERLAVSLNLADAVSFCGQVTDPYPYFFHADAFVLSSSREGLPTVLIEALAFDLPIVSTDAPSGPREILHDGRYGKLVPVGDEVALAHAICLTLLESRQKIPRVILEPYTVSTAVAHYLKILLPADSKTSDMV